MLYGTIFSGCKNSYNVQGSFPRVSTSEPSAVHKHMPFPPLGGMFWSGMCSAWLSLLANFIFITCIVRCVCSEILCRTLQPEAHACIYKKRVLLFAQMIYGRRFIVWFRVSTLLVSINHACVLLCLGVYAQMFIQ